MTADLSDRYPEAQVVESVFRDFGGMAAFHGSIVVVKVFEDNTLVRTLLEEQGDGRVLVIDGGGSRRCALVGGNLAQLGVVNGWAGIVVYGCVRDSVEIAAMSIGVKALASCPRRSEKGLHTGHRNRAVTFGGVTFRDGQWLYGDADGMVVSDVALHELTGEAI